MAIDRVKKVWLVTAASDVQEVPERLAAIGLLHVGEVTPAGPEQEAALSSLSADTREVDARIRKLTETLAVLGEFSKTARDLLSNLIPTPIETTRAELDAALAAIDVEELHRKAKDLAARRADAEAADADARARLESLKAFRGIRVTVPPSGSFRWTYAALWHGPARQAQRLVERHLAFDDAELEILGVVGTKALIASVGLEELESQVSMGLRDMGFELLAPPDQATELARYMEAIEAGERAHAAAAEAALAELAELGKLRHQAELVLGYWEEKRGTALALSKMVATGRARILSGYVRTRDLEAFEAAVARELPQVSLVAEDPREEDDVPVSLTNRRFFRPAQFLVEMFGLPGYFKFDPTAYLMLSFVVFFGFCLGDAIYGLVMLGIVLPLVRKYRHYPNLRHFFTLLAYCAVTSFLVGALTGTWAADIWRPQYLGKDNLFERFVNVLMIGDPLDKPLIALGVALAMGIANQFWGIAMRMYGYWRRGDVRSAVFDGGFWFLLLPGLVLLIAWFFSADKPAWMLRGGALLAAAGSIGLAFTQGRNEKTLVGKVAVGLVSLYGIVGSYGAVAFIGDTLSYSRLLALGLTTAIVGMAVNIIGHLVSGVPLVGVLLFLVIAVPGHFFNLLISGLGAFIHSARLIFVEFFGRFYEPGAKRFAPLGAVAGRIRVMD